jgi:outer membrane protein, heavy metal efflux system
VRAGGALHRAALGALALSVPALGCVPADAGYSDVRRLTSERIGRDVRWTEHEPGGASDQRTRALLAEPLDADAAVQVALLNNPQVQAAFEDLGVARGRLLEALQLPNPRLDAELRYHVDSDERPNIALAGTISLTDLLFLAGRNGVAGAELEAAKLSVAGQVLDLAFEARTAFYELQAAAQALELRRSVLEALRASFEAARALREAGNITELSYANERALYEQSRLDFSADEAALAARRERVSALLGVWGKELGWSPQPQLKEPGADPPELAQLETRALERSLDLGLIERRYRAAAKAANLAQLRGWVPELHAGVAVEREHDDELGWTVGPTVGLELPLFYQGQGARGVALANARREQRLYAATAIRIRAAARAAASSFVAAAKSLGHYREVLLPLRQQILDQTQLEYNAMSAGVFQLLQAKRDQIAASRSYVELLRDYWLRRADVEQLLAGRLPRSGAASTPEGPTQAEVSGSPQGH